MNRGVSLIETVFYVVLLALVMGIIVQMLISLSGIYKGIKLTRELESSGSIVMEGILREVRNASSVVTGESVLGTNPGVLTIAGLNEDLSPYEITFDTSLGVVRMSKNGSAPTAISSLSATSTLLIFTRVTNANSEGLRVELEISGFSGSVSKSQKFYGFTVLRGSY